MLHNPLQNVPLTFLDFETTGLHPHRGDRVCEVALQRVVGASVELSLAALVNPGRALSDPREVAEIRAAIIALRLLPEIDGRP